MNWAHGRTYLVSLVTSLLLCVVMLWYFSLRQGVMDLEALNHAIPNTSVILLGIILLIGPLSRVFDVFDASLKYRKDLGIVAFIYALFHALLIFLVFPTHNQQSRFSLTNVPFLFGLTGLFVLTILLVYSFEPIIRTLERRLWWKMQNWGVRIALILVAFHMVILNYRDWWKWLSRVIVNDIAFSNLPPLNLLVTIFIFFVILVRLSEILAKNFARRLIPIQFIGLSFVIVGLFVWSRLAFTNVSAKPTSEVHQVESEVNKGLVVNLRVGQYPILTNSPIQLEFLVSDKSNNNESISTKDLGSLFGKPMHVVGVRADLNQFFHIHPQELSPGRLLTEHTFVQPGKYQLWSWIKRDDTTYFYKHPSFTVAGESSSYEKSLTFDKQKSVDTYQVYLDYEEPIKMNQNTKFHFDFHNALGGKIELEPYIGALIHVSIFKDDLNRFIHGHQSGQVSTNLYFYEDTRAHEEGAMSESDEVSSMVTFPEPGIYKIFVDFRPKGISLPPDTALTAGFYIRVE